MLLVLFDHDGNNDGNDNSSLKEEEWQDVFDFLDLSVHFVKEINVVSSVVLVRCFGQIIQLKDII